MGIIADTADKVFAEKTIFKIADIANDYGTVTLNGLEFVNYEEREIPVFYFVEGNGNAFWAGSMKLAELADELLAAADGDLDEVNHAFKSEGLKIKITKTKTKKGNNFWQVDKIGIINFDTDELDEDYGKAKVVDINDDNPPF